MKRATTLLAMLVLLLSFSIVSCDSMFSTNVFAKMTHPTPSAADIASKTPAQMQEYVSSAENMSQLADDPSLKNAALGSLAAVYGSSATSLDQQTAAIVSAEISIGTVPDAVAFSGQLLSALLDGSTISTGSAEEVASFLSAALPLDIRGSVSPGAAMPSNFEAMINAFAQAEGAYAALGAGVGADGDYRVSLAPGQANDIAVNAVISGLVATIGPKNGATKAQALWSALTDPANAVTYIDVTSSSTLNTIATAPGAIANLVTQTILGSMFDN